jgi:hypothetical protein
MNNNELCVPASAVAGYEDDSDQSVEPAVGDSVEVTVAGKVSRVENGQVYFTPETANGEPISGHDEAPGGEDTDESMDALMKSQGAKGMGY